jgi:ankyrin repeat protein
LYFAAQENHIEVVKFLVLVGKANVNEARNTGETPLFAAAQQCRIDVVRWLVQEGKANINQANARGMTPLLTSLHAKVVNIAVPRFLLSVGARITSLDDPTFTGVIKAWIHAKVQQREVT